ncbi:MAG: SDR family NAD(P)-dependent oxidoreductase [Intrasporangiaceae bacterium]|nr:SDR family NAD(P)-dependent oxidoreductase [Intrasporangiaceae bacterium]
MAGNSGQGGSLVTDGFTDRDVTDQTGRTILVTGANSGIGFATAAVLARAGARVLLACRRQGNAEAAAARIREQTPDADLGLVLLDQASLASVAAAAAQVRDEEPRLDVLVNNAGVMAPPLTRTEDGFELQFGVNHLAVFALTAQLLPLLRERVDSRVVTTSSVVHRQGELLLDDPHAEADYDRFERYRQSKLANLMFALELDRRLRADSAPTASVACHPGLATTSLGNDAAPWVRRVPVARPLLRLRFNSAEQGAWPTLMAATDPSVEGGEYLGPTRRNETSGPAGRAQVADLARDTELAHKLWQLSVELTGLDPLS